MDKTHTFSKQQIESLYSQVRNLVDSLSKKMPYHLFYCSEIKATVQSYEPKKIIDGTEIFRIEIAKQGTKAWGLILFSIVPDENNQKQAIRIRGIKDAPLGFGSVLQDHYQHRFFEEYILATDKDSFSSRTLFGIGELLNVMLKDLSVVKTTVKS
jgi:hypothetical protein